MIQLFNFSLILSTWVFVYFSYFSDSHVFNFNWLFDVSILPFPLTWSSLNREIQNISNMQAHSMEIWKSRKSFRQIQWDRLKSKQHYSARRRLMHSREINLDHELRMALWMQYDFFNSRLFHDERLTFT